MTGGRALRAGRRRASRNGVPGASRTNDRGRGDRSRAHRLLGGCAAEPATTAATKLDAAARAGFDVAAAPGAVVAVRLSDALGLSVDAHAHRRVLAVLRYLSDA